MSVLGLVKKANPHQLGQLPGIHVWSQRTKELSGAKTTGLGS